MTEYIVLLPTSRDREETATVEAPEASPARFPSATEAVLQGMLWESVGLLEPGWDWGQV